MNQLKKKQHSDYRYSLTVSDQQKSLIKGKKLSKYKHLNEKSYQQIPIKKPEQITCHIKLKNNKKRQKQNKINNSKLCINKHELNAKRHSSSLCAFELSVLKQKKSNASVFIHQRNIPKLKQNNKNQYNQTQKPEKLQKTVKKDKNKEREKSSALSNYPILNQNKSKVNNKKNDNYRSMSAEQCQHLLMAKSKQKKQERKLSSKYNSSCIDLNTQNQFRKNQQKSQNKKAKKTQVSNKNKQAKKKQSFTFANIQIKVKKNSLVNDKPLSPSKRKQSYQTQYNKNCYVDAKGLERGNQLNFIKNSNPFDKQKSLSSSSKFIKRKSKSKPQILAIDLNSTKLKTKKQKVYENKETSPRPHKKTQTNKKMENFDLRQLQQAPYFLIMKQVETPQSELQFPINKYQKYNHEGTLQKTVKNNQDKQKPNKKNSKSNSKNNTNSKDNSKSRSRSRKNSASKFNNLNLNQIKQNLLSRIQKTKKSKLKLQVNASSLFCYSDSQEMFKNSDSQCHKLSNESKSNSSKVQPGIMSINLNQIRYFQEQNKQKLHEASIKDQPKLFHKFFRFRSQIIKDITDDYSLLTKKQLQFLASVIFIQRKWRQSRSTTKIKAIIKDILKPGADIINYYDKTVEIKDDYVDAKINCNEQYLSPHKRCLKQQKINSNILNTSPILQYNVNHNEILQESMNFFSSTLTKYRKEDDAFPEIAYLKIKKQLCKKQYLQNLEALKNNFLSSSFNKSQAKSYFGSYNKQLQIDQDIKYSRKQFQQKKQVLKQNYKKKLQNISNTKKVIKQGCLQYIQCINQTKSLIKLEGIRRVSSQHGMMSLLYKKVYNLDYQMKSNSSQSSNKSQKRLFSLQDDSKMDQAQQISQNQTLKRKNHLELEGQKSVGFSTQKQGIKTESETKKTQQNSGNNQQKSNQLRIRTDNSSTLFNISKLLTISEYSLLSSSLAQNTKNQGNKELSNIYIKDQNIQLNKIQQTGNQIQNEQAVGQIQAQYAQPRQHQRQIFLQQDDDLSFDNVSFEDVYFKMDSIKINDKNSGFQFNQNANFSYRIPNSPKSERYQKSFTSNKHSELYIKEFLVFLMNDQKNIQNLMTNLNKYQGFPPLSYLNFLRTFQLPDQQYEPIVQNQRFIQWQDEWISKNDTKCHNQIKLAQNNQLSQQTLNQSLTIFHRSLFQFVGNQFQKYRIYGQKGKPFPWQRNYSSEISPYSLSVKKVQKIIKNIQKVCKRKIQSQCGIIEQNHDLIISEEDLEQLHDKNEDRIIQMLEDELQQSPNNWYEIDQHSLQVKIQISEVVWEELFEQLIVQALSLLL